MLLVLAGIVIITILTLAVLAVVKTEIGASSNFSGGALARVYAESALNTVMGTIRNATEQGANVAWISQPGLIRTYDTSGNAINAFKLYSSDTLIVTGSFDPIAANDAPTTWQTTGGPLVYCDLNEPVVKDGFPSYPIINPEALDTGYSVTGFSVSPTVSDYTNASGNTVTNPYTGANFHVLPMPVKWIYIFKDGTQSAATFVDTTHATLPTGHGPPIARVAYWTDDDCCKVNLNTAAGGVPWDTPIANTFSSTFNPAPFYTAVRPSTPDILLESDFAEYVPGLYEFQRYPGHPATTDLFPILANSVKAALGLSTTTLPADRNAIREAIYANTSYNGTTSGGVTPGLVPRYMGGAKTSQEGTVPGGGIPAFVQNRLYATLDEMLYVPGLAALVTPASTRVESPSLYSTTGTISFAARRNILDESRFFLTAHSRAPEVNLYNQPRVAIWPIYSSSTTGAYSATADAAHLTAFDNMIAFCSTVGLPGSTQTPFYFTRSNPLSTSADWNTQNQNVYGYLDTLIRKPIPGFGGNLWTKFGGASGDGDQILTEIFDYIRCLNLADVSTSTSGAQIIPYTQKYNSYADNYYSGNIPQAWGMVLPIIPTSGNALGTQGFGRIPIISQILLIIVPLPPDSSGNAQAQLGIFPEVFCPMNGFTPMAANFQATFSGLTGITVNGTSLAFQTNQSGNDSRYQNTGLPSTPDICVLYNDGLWFMDGNNEDNGQPGGTPYNGCWSTVLGGMMGAGTLCRNTVPMSNLFSVASGSIVLAGSFKIALAAPYRDPANPSAVPNPNIQPYQTYTFNLGTITIPAPTYNTDPLNQNSLERVRNAGTQGVNPQNFTNGGYKVTDSYVDLEANASLPGNKLQDDFRIVAANLNTSTSSADAGRYFVVGPKLGGNPDNLRTSFGQGYAGINTGGNLIAGISQNSYNMTGGTPHGSYWRFDPEVPYSVNGVVNAQGNPGDWDNGPGLQDDGAYVNKADEGAVGESNQSIAYLGDPYDQYATAGQISPTQFSPNRQIASPVMFGSLPVGVKRGLPWQTLLFRPSIAGIPNLPGSNGTGSVLHPGVTAPEDHLLLDLFWMPVVEPYAISEPFSTAGKINLNYQIAPFTNINRDSGIRALLGGSMITALNPNAVDDKSGYPFVFGYKVGKDIPNDFGDSGVEDVSIRYQIDPDETLAFFQSRFANNQPFISGSQICDIPLVPLNQDSTHIPSNSSTITTSTVTLDAALNSFWGTNNLTGDNSLEKPYNTLYPRVTTKSNTYTVHVRSQMLAVNAATWNGTLNLPAVRVQGEYRGSYVVERYLDPTSQTADYSGNNALGPYKMRIVETNQVTQ